MEEVFGNKLVHEGLMHMTFRANSFFSGIGGFDLGLEKAGFGPMFHCELDQFCKDVLRTHWPDIHLHSDIRTLQADAIPDAEVWSGGFPCQDVSVARASLQRDGLRGANSGLFFPFVDLLASRFPPVVLIENVTGLLNSHDGLDFEIVLQRLTDLGYGVAWRVVNSRYYGVPQSRPRVFLCAWYKRPDLACHALYEPDTPPRPLHDRSSFLKADHCERTGAVVPRTAYCLAATSGRHTGTDWSRSYVSFRDAARRLTPSECERLQGFPEGWTLPQDRKYEDTERLDSLRYKALGNAVSVPVVTWIGHRISDGLRVPPRLITLLSSSTEEVIQDLSAFLPVPPHRQRSGILNPESELSHTGREMKWQPGGCAFAGAWVSAKVPSAPKEPIESRFINVLDSGKVDRRYYLSPNAAVGMLRRARSQKRTLFKWLEKALTELARRDDINGDLPVTEVREQKPETPTSAN